MLAEALCKLEGFTFAPSDSVYRKHGYSTEQDFIYVTTANLTHEQLQQLSDEVGAGAYPLGALHRLPRSRGVSKPYGEEEPQAGALPVRVGARRLQPQGGEPARPLAVLAFRCEC